MTNRQTAFGWGQRIGFGVAGVLILSLTFTLGILVGRQWARPSPGPTGANAVSPAVTAKSGGPGSTGVTAPPPTPEQQEKLTFYQTLTRPVAPVQPPRGTQEARPEAKPAPGSLPTSPRGPAAARPEEPRARERALPPAPRLSPSAGVEAPPPRPTPAAVQRAQPPAVETAARWTVQVGAFKSREQAETVQRRLAGSGFSAAITATDAADGGPRFRVRVGSFVSRAEAEETAARVKGEGGLSTFVTPL
jgi:cell division protein FtsN